MLNEKQPYHKKKYFKNMCIFYFTHYIHDFRISLPPLEYS